MHLVSSTDLRPRLGEYLERAKGGDEVVVLIHGRPAARLRAIRPDDVCPLVPVRSVRDELHAAISKARATALTVTWRGRTFAVLEALPEGLAFEDKEEVS
jgi:prevent-host-death family protein